MALYCVRVCDREMIEADSAEAAVEVFRTMALEDGLTLAVERYYSEDRLAEFIKDPNCEPEMFYCDIGA
jgi:hypothetical protein